MSAPNKTSEWQVLAEKKARKVLHIARKSRVLKKLGPSPNWGMDVHMVGPRKMISLNRRFRKKAKVTDVLSFPAPDPILKTGYLGELVICLNQLKKQAVENQIKSEHELVVLIVHGFLHLLGMDHEGNQKQAGEMLQWEKRLLSRVLNRKVAGLIQRTR